MSSENKSEPYRHSTIILTSIITAVIGALGATLVAELQNKPKAMEIAIGIINSPEDERGPRRQIRDWAIDVLEKYSGVPISKQKRDGILDYSSVRPASPTIRSAPLQAAASLPPPRDSHGQKTVTTTSVPPTPTIYPEGVLLTVGYSANGKRAPLELAPQSGGGLDFHFTPPANNPAKTGKKLPLKRCIRTCLSESS